MLSPVISLCYQGQTHLSSQAVVWKMATAAASVPNLLTKRKEKKKKGLIHIFKRCSVDEATLLGGIRPSFSPDISPTHEVHALEI